MALVTLFPVSWMVASTTDTSLNIGTMVASYGIAAPFAVLCWWQMTRSQAKVDKLETEIRSLQEDAVSREKEFAQRLAPLLYDGAMLYRQGNEQLKQGLDRVPPEIAEIHSLAESVKQLVEKLEGK